MFLTRMLNTITFKLALPVVLAICPSAARTFSQHFHRLVLLTQLPGRWSVYWFVFPVFIFNTDAIYM